SIMASHSPDAEQAPLPIHGQTPQDYLNERVQIECEEEDEVYGKCSADVTFARDRLAVLLQQIKKGDVVVPVVKEQKKKVEEDDGTERRGPGRPRKMTKNDPRQVIFELRGKGFTLRDSDGIESVYSLCRIWYNTRKEDEKVTRDRIARDREAREEEERVAQYDDSLDLLATKEIHALPRPRSPTDIQLWPERSERLDSQIVLTGRAVNEGAVKKAYAAHWKNVKKNWVSHQREVDQRFYRSINLLETVHGIAQQNAL
ncbi:lin-37, partial [Pristionchus pacificus]|uniref:Uncharacterized protein n=1 Tax=Pristionchus pacificus TaxID=54126 RepID=A0A8R1V5F3_PRIPA